jgi:polysaccharide biosynthesis transport protein
MNTLPGNRASRGQESITYQPPAPLEPRSLPALDAEPSPGDDFVSLAAYWHILRKRRWAVLTTVVALTTLVAIASFKTKPVYRATSRVQVEAETPLIQSLNDLYQKMDTDDVFLQTQIQVLKSDHLAWQTVEQLRLGENSNFTDPKTIAKTAPEQRKVLLISQFKDGLDVELIPRTRVLTVNFESTDPKLAALVSNALVNNYIDYNFRQKYDATRQASGWMEQQLDDLKAKVETSQQALVDYERQHAIADVGTKDRQSVEEQVLSDLSKDRTAAQADRIQKESLYNQVLANRAQIASLAHNDLLQKLEESSAQLKEQHLDALAQYGPKFPKVVRLKEQVAENQAQIVQEQNRVLERIRNDYATARDREKLAIMAVDRQKEELGNANQLLVQRNILQRDFDANQQLYQNLMQRLKDATVSAGLRSTNIHLVDSALAPEAPVRPKTLLNISLGLFAGIILGAMLAFAQEAVDHSITSAEEAEALLGVPALASIPLQRGTGRPARNGLALRGVGSAELDAPLGLTVVKKPSSIMAEAYRSLRTAVLLSLPNCPPKTILIVSAQAGDGKTSTCLNLGSTLAQRKGPVLLIDADLRKQGLSRELKLNNDKGLSTVLAGTHEAEEALQPSQLLPELWILPSGPVPPNPADLLSSEKMLELLCAFGERFEHVVIDSPPVLAVTDSTILSRIVDGVALVIQSGNTPRGALLRTHRTLETAGARILGLILNKFDHRQQGYYYGYRYGYKSYYGHYGEQNYPYGSTSSSGDRV